MDGIDVLKKVITDSRFWAALWIFAQSFIRQMIGDNAQALELLEAANTFFGVLMVIVFGVSKVSTVGQEVVANERGLLARDLEYDAGMTDKGVRELVALRRAEAAQAKAAGDIADTDFQP